jgi:hypothetical protein
MATRVCIGECVGETRRTHMRAAMGVRSSLRGGFVARPMTSVRRLAFWKSPSAWACGAASLIGQGRLAWRGWC